MTDSSNTLARAAFVVAVICGRFAAAPASADVLPVSLRLGGQIPISSSNSGVAGNAQTDFGLDVDFGPKTIVPIRASLQLDDATSSNFNEFGVGVAARLTTPIYAGAGISIYHVSESYGIATPASSLPGTSASSGTVSIGATSVGENFFIGDRIAAFPGGFGLSVEAAYKNIPTFDGINPSAASLGLRLQL